MTDLDTLLERTSRTFALTIPLLPEPTRDEVLVAYLLFRIADTFEDSTEWSADARVRALHDFADLVAEPDPERARELGRAWVVDAPIAHEGYTDLLRHTGAVIDAYARFSEPARRVIARHVSRTARGMAEFVRRAEEEGGELSLESIEALKAYCYVVAGIVGEMLTDLFLLDRPELEPVKEGLESRARHFGEGLQLTNILKDSDFDATEGRRYIGSAIERRDVFDLARQDLGRAVEYTLLLQEAGAQRGLVAFNALPVLLALATLERVRTEGPGAKISRDEVWTIVERMNRALDDGTPVVPPSGFEGPTGTSGPLGSPD